MSRFLSRKSTESDSHRESHRDAADEDFQQNLIGEISTLRCKIDSKSKALTILSQDLIEIKHERDEYKLMAEQIRDRYTTLRRRVEGLGPSLSNVYQGSSMPTSAVTQVLCDLTEQNKRLIYEIDELKMKLIDAEGDLKMLREQMHGLKIRSYEDTPEAYNRRSPRNAGGGLSDQRVEEVVSQLEVFRSRVELMERDLQCVLDEKEELIMSRDEYKAKVDRLNKRLNDILRGGSAPRYPKKSEKSEDGQANGSPEKVGAVAYPKVLDIDSIVTENRFLQERVAALQDEKKLADNALGKYKSIFEKANGKKNILNSIGFSRRDAKSSALVDPANPTEFDMNAFSGNVISSKQVQHFIASNNLNNLEVSQSSISHLRSLVVALFEAFCDKSSALSLQKRNNKLLGKRISELEDKIRELQAKEKVFLLMKDENFSNYPDLTMAIPESEPEDAVETESVSEGPPNSDPEDETSRSTSMSSFIEKPMTRE